MAPERTPSQAPFLRLPWKRGRIGGRAGKTGLFLLGGLLAWIFLFSEAGLLQQVRQRSNRAQLQREVGRLEEEARFLREEALRLENDPAYRERIAREEWGYKRPGEKVYHIHRP